MAIITEETKLGKYWDLDKFANKNELLKNSKIAQIYEMSELAKAKVTNNEWTEKEYNDFCSIMKQINMVNLPLINRIVKRLLELNNDELEEEINYLISIQIVTQRKETDTLHKTVGYAVSDLKSKIIQYFKRMTDSETIKNYHNINESITSAEEVLTQLNDNNSELHLLIREVYKDHIEKTFKDSKMKVVLLNLEDIVLEFIVKDYRRLLNSLVCAKDRKAIGETLDSPIKYKALRAIKNKNHYKVYGNNH